MAEPQNHSDSESDDDSFDSNSFASSSSDDDSDIEPINSKTPQTSSGSKILSVPTNTGTRKLTQKEQLLRAEQERKESNKVEWLDRAQKVRTSVIHELEVKRQSGVLSNVPEFQPEWVAIAKEQQIARDLRGIERFLQLSAPQLPPEPVWIQEAKLKRRDVPLLLKPNEAIHESNKQAPIWGESAQKILSAFLKEDSEALPQWMSQGVGMNQDEKKELLAQLAQLRALLEEEYALTAAKQTQLEKAKQDFSDANNKLNDGIKAFRLLRENRKAENAGSFVESSQKIFEESQVFCDSLKSEYSLDEKVKFRVDRHIAKDTARQEQRAKELAEKKALRAAERKAKRKEKKDKKASVGSEAKPSSENNPVPSEDDSTIKKKKSRTGTVEAAGSKKKKKSRTIEAAAQS